MKDTERIAELERKMDIIMNNLDAHDRMLNSKIDLVRDLTKINSRLLKKIMKR